jgi:hypothetical protein
VGKEEEVERWGPLAVGMGKAPNPPRMQHRLRLLLEPLQCHPICILQMQMLLEQLLEMVLRRNPYTSATWTLPSNFTVYHHSGIIRSLSPSLPPSLPFYFIFSTHLASTYASLDHIHHLADVTFNTGEDRWW